jgi:8-oxo-dGTP pyrophosphatase MutT (NUDIX family)
MISLTAGINMLGFKILVDGVFAREKLHINYRDEEKHYPPRAMEHIDRIWRRDLSSGIRLFDGRLFEVVSYGLLEQILSVRLRNTSYKIFVGARDREFTSELGYKMRANPLSVGAVVVSSDNRFIIGKRRSDLYFSIGKYSIIAGMMDRDKDLTDGTPDPFKAILRELWEEKGVQREDVQEALSLGLIYNLDYNQTYMPFYIRLRIPSSILEKSTPHEYEFEKFIYLDVEPDAVSNLLTESSNLLDGTCQGNILLFGKKAFGVTWMKKMLRKLKVGDRKRRY